MVIFLSASSELNIALKYLLSEAKTHLWHANSSASTLSTTSYKDLDKRSLFKPSRILFELFESLKTNSFDVGDIFDEDRESVNFLVSGFVFESDLESAALGLSGEESEFRFASEMSRTDDETVVPMDDEDKEDDVCVSDDALVSPLTQCEFGAESNLDAWLETFVNKFGKFLYWLARCVKVGLSGDSEFNSDIVTYPCAC